MFEMTKKKVLFVDDEANVLDGLRRMLRSMRKEFDLNFAESGKQALALMEGTTFDIIISDMRMPGIDGADLLIEVRRRSPHTIRVILTGQADDEALMRTVGGAHQVLAKPCDSKQLTEILRKSKALQDMMAHEPLREIISSIDTLPSLPSLYEKLQEMLKDPDVQLADIGKIIGGDVAMTAKVLQLVNSAFFGLFQKVDTPERAVSLLGLDTIKALVLGVQIFSEMQCRENRAFVDSLWSHCMTVGVLAKKIANEETDDESVIADAFLGGVLHDIGKLLLISNMATEYKKIRTMASEERISLYEAEKKTLNASHCEVGGYLLGLWGFQSAIVEAIAFHHQLDKFPVPRFSATLAIHLANRFFYELQSDEIDAELPALDETYIEECGLTDHLDRWRDICRRQLEQQEEEG
jgi:putative nucleotidyltransferase with HDIG domain